MNTKTLRFLALLPTILAGCKFGDGFDPYYDGGGAPSISGLDINTESGNTGGQEVTITGTNFGGDPAGVTVIFGSRNARVLKAADSELLVEVPPGPLQAGLVDVLVGTAQGQVRLAGGYNYDVGDIDAEEIGFITVTNDYWSCLGGIGNTLDSFCQTWAFSGDSGVDGRGEFLKWTMPRLHAVYTGERGGFATSSDVSWGEWSMQVPSYAVNTLDLEGEYEDWRHEVGNFTLTNSVHEDDTYCSDMSQLAQYRYAGWEPNPENEGEWLKPVSVGGGDTLTEEVDCKKDPWGKEYALNTLQFCEEKQYEVTESKKWLPEWPVGADFFSGLDDRNRKSSDYPANVVLNAPGIGVENLELALPEYSFFAATIGSGASGSDPTNWSVYTLSSTCPDSDENGVTDLDDAAWRWEWAPTQADLSPHGPIRSVRTYVRATVSNFTLAWYGGEGLPIRASITVPDDWNYDKETGMSHVDLPTSILYQFPSSNLDYGVQYDPFGAPMGFKWGDPFDPTYALMIITLERVTEYAIDVNLDGQKGVVMFAYSTGDVGQLDFTSPLDKGDCSNCIDGDGDGWTDRDDPDCDEGESEDDATFGDYTCNDGVDNDGNGFIDSEDPNCESGMDGETNCSDNADNDGDGLTDEEDGECGELGSGFELGEDDPTWGCIDEVDNDSDGWVDFDDPDCENGADEELGFGDTECNDGIDNDGHGDVDADDLTCRRRGAAYNSEVPGQSNECTDKADNDSDGYTDGNDPDCEYNGYDEKDPYVSSSTDPYVAACYNGVDDDGDGWIDALDPGCVNEAGDPDGFVSDEDATNPGYTACEDSVDNDSDGWTDGDDPDCASTGGEWDFGSTQCNNGDDDDGDTFVDVDDPECTNAADDDEGA